MFAAGVTRSRCGRLAGSPRAPRIAGLRPQGSLRGSTSARRRRVNRREHHPRTRLRRPTRRSHRARCRAPPLGLLLIWAALVVGADGLGLLPQIGVADAWNWIFLSAGTLATIGCVRRLLSHPRQDPDRSDYAVAGQTSTVPLMQVTVSPPPGTAWP